MHKVVVMGLGYIGLPTATVLALRGFDVLGVDISPQVVDTLKQGKIHIVEPDLDVSVAAAIKSGPRSMSRSPLISTEQRLRKLGPPAARAASQFAHGQNAFG